MVANVDGATIEPVDGFKQPSMNSGWIFDLFSKTENFHYDLWGLYKKCRFGYFQFEIVSRKSSSLKKKNQYIIQNILLIQKLIRNPPAKNPNEITKRVVKRRFITLAPLEEERSILALFPLASELGVLVFVVVVNGVRELQSATEQFHCWYPHW